MVTSTYETVVLLNDSKHRLFSIVLYGRIFIEGIEICKIPLEIDALSDDMYYATLEYEVFIKNWELQRIEMSRSLMNQFIRFYENVEELKVKFNIDK